MYILKRFLCIALLCNWQASSLAESDVFRQPSLDYTAAPARTFFNQAVSKKWAEALESSNIDKIDEMLSEDSFDVDRSGEEGMTALFFAVLRSKHRLAEKLLSHGADPNVLLDNCLGMLEVAASDGDNQMLKLLLDYGGNPNIVSGMNFLQPPLLHLVGPPDEPDALSISLLIEAGANPNFLTEDGERPAHWAAQLIRFDLAYQLVLAGADPHLRDGFGETLGQVIESKKRVVNHESFQYAWMRKLEELISQYDSKAEAVQD